MTENEQIIRNWLNDNWEQLQINSRKVCTYNSDKWAGDLLIHVVEDFLKKSIEYQIKVFNDGKIEQWITKAMSMQVRSGTSTFYNTYRRNLYNSRGLYLVENGETRDKDIYTIEEDLYDEKDKGNYECMKWAVSQLNFYDQALIDKRYDKGWTIDSIHKFYGIAKSHLNRDYKRITKQIQESCKQFI